MKSNLKFAIILLSTILQTTCLIETNCQEIGVQGSTWYYTKAYHPVEYPTWGVVKVVYERDTIIANDTAKVFNISEKSEISIFQPVDTVLLFEKGMKVFYQWRNKLGLLYDFDVNIGDTVVYDLPFYAKDHVGDTTIRMKIDSIKIEDFGAKEFKTIYQSLLEDDMNYDVYFNKISQRFGNWDYLLPQPLLNSADFDLVIGIRCYEDFEYQYKSPTYALIPCDTVIATHNQVNIDNSRTISIFPNPCSEYLFIDGISQNSLVEFFSMTGQKLLEIEISPNTNKTNISMLPAGGYLMRVYENKVFQTIFLFKY